MEVEGLDLNKVSAGAESNRKCGDGFSDRSEVKILLCDNNTKSSEEVLTLLLGCSYQVTSVRSARQVINALNTEGQDIDIILAEVDLPMKKGMKMLKYITQDKVLHRIPVIMMSAQDEVSIVIKCLRLGAADYLVKPLRTNELLNLWTHIWRRSRMLGLTEKNILNYDLDLVASDPSDANTTSTTLFSDDTEDKTMRSPNPETGISIQQEYESTTVADAVVAADIDMLKEPPDAHPSKHRPDVSGINDCQITHFSSGPKKIELRIRESSAFFRYVETTTQKGNSQGIAQVDDTTAAHLTMKDMHQACSHWGICDLQAHENGEPCSSARPCQDDIPGSNSIPDSFSIKVSSTSPASMGIFKQKYFNEQHLPQGMIHLRNGSETKVSSIPAQHAYPYYISGVVNHIPMPSLAQLYQKNLQDRQNHASTTMITQYNNISQCPSYPYYPVSICLQPGQMSTSHSWPSVGSSSSPKVQLNKVDRRAAALMKFRQKRKERCFDKKIRYVNRKRLAESRPRVRGQFVQKLNGVNVDLNGQPSSIDYDDDDEEDEETCGKISIS